MILVVLPCSPSSLSLARVARVMELLKPPQSPRSAVATTKRCVSSLPVPRIIAGASSRSPMTSASEPTMRSMRSEKGRAASAASCARRSLDAATSFIAEVIFWVWRTLLMRTRRSLRLAMAVAYFLNDTRA